MHKRSNFVELIVGCKYHYEPLDRWKAEGEDGGTVLVTYVGPIKFEIEVLTGVKFLAGHALDNNTVKVEIGSDFHKGLSMLPEEPPDVEQLEILFDDIIQ